jgi:hypothetical protein
MALNKVLRKYDVTVLDRNNWKLQSDIQRYGFIVIDGIINILPEREGELDAIQYVDQGRSNLVGKFI